MDEFLIELLKFAENLEKMEPLCYETIITAKREIKQKTSNAISCNEQKRLILLFVQHRSRKFAFNLQNCKYVLASSEKNNIYIHSELEYVKREWKSLKSDDKQLFAFGIKKFFLRLRL